MYNNYLNYLNTIDEINFEEMNFKSNQSYNGILEHVSYELGVKYLTLIENDFNNIEINNIIDFLTINDKYGFPNKHNYSFITNTIVFL